jgi:hypothetical protein
VSASADPSSRGVHWDDEPTEEEQHGASQAGGPDGFDPSRLPASQRLQYQLLVALSKTAEWGGWALKYGWLPFVAFVGMSNVYCSSSQMPFEHIYASAQPPKQ